MNKNKRDYQILSKAKSIDFVLLGGAAIWLTLSFIIWLGFLNHLTALAMIVLFLETPDWKSALFGLANLFCTWIYGRLYFNVFMSPGTKVLLPARTVLKNPAKILRTLIESMYTMAWSALAVQTGILITRNKLDMNVWAYGILFTVMVTWTLRKWLVIRYRKIESDVYEVDIRTNEELQLLSQANTKIRKNCKYPRETTIY